MFKKLSFQVKSMVEYWVLIFANVDKTTINLRNPDLRGILEVRKKVAQLTAESNVHMGGAFMTGRGLEAGEYHLALYKGILYRVEAEYGGIVIERKEDGYIRWEYTVPFSIRLEALKLQQKIVERWDKPIESKQTMVTVREEPKKIEQSYEELLELLRSLDIGFIDLVSGEVYGNNPRWKTTHSRTGLDVIPMISGKDVSLKRELHYALSSYGLKGKDVTVILIGDSVGDIPFLNPPLVKKILEPYVRGLSIKSYGVNPTGLFKEYIEEIGGTCLYGTPESCFSRCLVCELESL